MAKEPCTNPNCPYADIPQHYHWSKYVDKNVISTQEPEVQEPPC